jgi:hypothetical protein
MTMQEEKKGSSAQIGARLAMMGLPEIAFIDNCDGRYPVGAPVIGIRRGEAGFHAVSTRLTARELNEQERVSEHQVRAMLMGSLFGWDTPGADPRRWQSRGHATADTVARQQGGSVPEKPRSPRPPVGYATWLDYAVATMDTRTASLSALEEDWDVIDGDREAMRRAVQEELRALREAVRNGDST